MRKFLSILLIGFLFFFGTSFKPGSANAILEGTSDSGRTKFYIEIQDLDGLTSNASLSIDGEGIIFLDDNAEVIFDDKLGVLTFNLVDGENSSKRTFLKFWSIPSSFKTLTKSGSKEIYTFKAYVISTDPRDHKTETPKIKLNCKLSYSI